MAEQGRNKVSRREFLRTTGFTAGAVGLCGLTTKLAMGTGKEELLWQLDPTKCTQCGKCATNCVLTESAVKCTHNYSMCGYCTRCFGYFQPETPNLNEGAENQLCPTGALKRVFIEEPYFEYHIDEELCVGCGKCVKGCETFGNGSLFLQIQHDRCLNCNECAIARSCPSEAFKRVPEKKPYLPKGGDQGDEKG